MSGCGKLAGRPERPAPSSTARTRHHPVEISYSGRLSAAGSEMMKVAPWPGSLATVTAAAVGLDDGLDEAQAEPEAALGPAGVAPEEPVPDAR